MTEHLNLNLIALLITYAAGMMRHDRPASQSLGRCRGVQ